MKNLPLNQKPAPSNLDAAMLAHVTLVARHAGIAYGALAASALEGMQCLAGPNPHHPIRVSFLALLDLIDSARADAEYARAALSDDT